MSYSTLDTLAIKHNIRIIHPDRPGVGGTNSVPIEERIPVYLAMIPHLLQHLGIEHVSLAAHSFGTIYAINTLLLYPYLLYHENPYVAFFAPWVHPDHTGMRYLQAAELLPAGMIGKFSSVARWVNESVLPVVGMSTGLSASIADSLKNLVPLSNAAAVPPLDQNTE
jgi:pimeloyl-ACP methyl ester carboxylesterase